MYAILLTHHGCGPDSVISHYFREEMKGKPYLHIEVDEHSSGVGVITRVEAFINSLKNTEVKALGNIKSYSNNILHKEANIKSRISELSSNTVLYLPYIYPYSEIFQQILIHKGINARVLPGTNRASVDAGRKFTITEEYFSLTALLGDVFKELYRIGKVKSEHTAFFIPQNEGTETYGQYSRLLRTKLDEEGFQNADVVSPFIEDALYQEEEVVKAICFGLLAGDIVRVSYKNHREKHLSEILALIRDNRFDPDHLEEIAREIHEELKSVKFKKSVLVAGEAMILYNDFLNGFTFRNIEEKGHRVVYSPFSETMWMLWRDFSDQNRNENTPIIQSRLDEFKRHIDTISRRLSDYSPFEKDLNRLVATADQTMGYYSGANVRYREAKLLGDLKGIDGIITAVSMYENTGIVLGVLHKGFKNDAQKPILNLTFDGNKNENDETKIESFMYYL